jgi:hypothetical protein
VTFVPGDYQALASILKKYFSDKSWHLEQARRNFKASKKFVKSVLDARRSKFLDGFKKACE